MKTRFILLILIGVINTSCIFLKGKSKSVNDFTTYTWMKGQIFTNAHINKEGKPNPESKDYYFRYYGVNYYIKFSECNFEGDISNFNNNFVQVLGEIKNGPWENENKKNKGRSGDYVVFSDIKTIERPVKIIYTDGNNNNHILISSKLQYDPVMIIESSSGIYCGGSEKEANISPETFFEIYVRLIDICETGKYHSENRIMGSSQIQIEYIDKKEVFILVDNKELQDAREYIHSFFEKH